MQTDRARVAIHTALTFVMMGLGGILLLSEDTFHQSAAWRLFLQARLTEPQVALGMLVVGMAGLLGYNRSNRVMQMISTGILATAHGALGAAFWIGSPTGGAIVPYTGYMGLGYTLLWLEWRRR